ncbi:MAG: IS3 family transposase [Thermodesulfobacteriota bacterium]
MIEHMGKDLSVRRKCELLDVGRSRIYYKKKPPKESDAEIMNVMRDVYQRHPFFGYRRMHAVLKRQGFVVNRKRTQRLMSIAGLKSIYPKKRTTTKNSLHKTYPFLLPSKDISRSNVAWAVDITYIKTRRGFVYLVCLIDIFSRRVMGWSLSITLDTAFCMEALESALNSAKPEVINSDQGCQFTSSQWTEKLQNEGIEISMDGKGRWADNIYIERFWRSLKYESVFLHSFETVAEAKSAIASYIEFYNDERPHQSLGYKTPNCVYKENQKKGSKYDELTKGMLVKRRISDSQIQANFWS